MSVTKRFTHCPQCSSGNIREIGRIEAHEIPGVEEDAAIYECRDCGNEWDTEMITP